MHTNINLKSSTVNGSDSEFVLVEKDENNYGSDCKNTLVEKDGNNYGSDCGNVLVEKGGSDYVIAGGSVTVPEPPLGSNRTKKYKLRTIV